ncbi:MAG TPA: FAD-dependent oxidoreductase [Chlorobaculum parvum]|uniref:FAD-dependent oxidoreductase n=1 Tax=Chlorobaculum parvum TaxID=274539 RepID=A0A7C5HS93_9CHLB|nr:FAD-dependent oxidoreductase [Chlorobaculum parvum]
MDLRDLHCIVIGAGIGGLAAVALLARRGVQVVVLEAQRYPGGCAATFSSGDYRFDAGATVGCGFHPGGPLDRLGRELGIDWPVHSEPLAWQYRHRDLRLDLLSSRDAIISRFPRSKAFWKEQGKIARLLWQLSAEALPWPVCGVRDVADLVSRSLAVLPDSARLLPFMRRTAWDWLRRYRLHADPEFVRFIDAQLLISVQTTSLQANALNAAIALDLPVAGTWSVEGGIGTIAQQLADSIERDGGAVLYGKKVTRLDTINREVLGVETADGDALATDMVVANLTHDSFVLLNNSAPELESPASSSSGWSAFVLYLGVDASLFERAGADHLQIVAPEGELGECRSLFVSASPAGDAGRAPEGQRAVTVSTHTRPERWFEALRQGREAYEALKQEYTDKALTLLYEQLPEARDAIRSVTAATPHSWENWTGRLHGLVGGYAQTSLFGVPGPATKYNNLFLVGDSIFPGQSLPGVVTGARRTVELILRRAARQRR